jgi:8-oxo-dGTP diphosphatase
MADNDRTRGRKIRRAAGCVVYRLEDGVPHFLLIRDPYERWSLPKGHLEGNETDAEAAVREVLEETGISGELGLPIATVAYTFVSHGHMIEKRVAFFLMRATSGEAKPQIDEGISAIDWFPAQEALRRMGYEQIRDVLSKAIAMVPSAS